MTIKRVVQRDATGCGIACAAMVAGTSYARARKAAIDLKIAKERPPHYTTSAELGRLLEILGAKAERCRKLAQWSSLNSLSIVGINYSEANDTWHWVVYIPSSDGGYVLDPKARIKTVRRVDFSRMRPNRYMRVTRPNNSSKPTPLRGAT